MFFGWPSSSYIFFSALIILQNALQVDFSGENGKKLALLILASADKPFLKKVGTTYEESSFWLGDLPQNSDDYQRIKGIEGEVIYHPPWLDKDPEQRVRGAEILIRLKNQSGFHQTDLPRFIQLAREHADKHVAMTHLEETATGHQLILSDKKIQFKVRILLEGKIEKAPSQPIMELSEAEIKKNSRLRRNGIIQNLRRLFRSIFFS